MSFVLAFLGFALLIILHEAGHFVVAKAVGMRVERFSLFFPPLIWKRKRGETEYGIGAIPLGGYVKITGMNPEEEIPPEIVHRAYYNQPVWKRVVTILAGPAVNILIAFAIVAGLYVSSGEYVPVAQIHSVQAKMPASSVLRPGDQIVSVDGRDGSTDSLRAAVERHHCAGPEVDGCTAATAARVVVRRDNVLKAFTIRPRYSKASGQPVLGFEFDTAHHAVGIARASSLSASYLWYVTRRTVSTLVRIFEPRERRQLSSVVGAYDRTQASFSTSATQGLTVLALISLSLGVINLFPFLPLDGGHVFWAVAEKVRRRRISFAVMERAGLVGFALVILVFLVGLSNDLSSLTGTSLGLR